MGMGLPILASHCPGSKSSSFLGRFRAAHGGSQALDTVQYASVGSVYQKDGSLTCTVYM